MQKCDPRAIARCQTRKMCGDYIFVEGSDCDKFNQQVCNNPLTYADHVRSMNDEEMATEVINFAINSGWIILNNATQKAVLIRTVWQKLIQPAEKRRASNEHDRI